MNNVNWDCIINFPFKKEEQLPKTWEEFCGENPLKKGECYIGDHSFVEEATETARASQTDKRLLPDRATAEAILALCQLIQLRNTYNGDWVPELSDNRYEILFTKHGIQCFETIECPEILFFKSEELRNEFLANFCPLIEKLKPLYGIKEGGEK